ncbi:peptidoglycan-binding protein LysM [Terrihabitans soli]|uniref:Peptidoglycan-binding protein LysM n=1 Tax=Terrihabitans soli TaxID=708113 RepID=A0A6S6QGY2_9HYPH|nr:LysM peptidoglycan-binding domain-containing protein [Terrihabitans soli]BCJ90413.1 peptidoglycan-binding protein LysM [Terrihabitans soli]
MNARLSRLAVLGLVVVLAAGAGIFARQYLAEQNELTPDAMPEQAPLPKLAMPEVPAPAAQQPAGPGFDVVRVEPTGDAIVAGRAAPGSEVELLANGGVIDKTLANEAGEFVIMPPPLSPGSHELTLRTKEAASRQAVTVSVPEPGKGEVLVVVGEPGKPSQVVQAGAPQGPGAGLIQPPAIVAADQAAPLRIGAVESENGRLYVQGSGPPGARTVIYLNDAPLAEAEIGTDGRWSLTVERGLTKGDYRVRVDQAGEAGKVLARVEVPFTAEGSSDPASSSTEIAAAPKPASGPESEPQTTASVPSNPVVAQLGTIEVRRGDNLWRISRKAYGAGDRYSTIYQANSDQIRDPDRIYPGQIFVMPPGG